MMKRQVKYIEFIVRNYKLSKSRTMVFPVIFDPGTVKDQVNLRLNPNEGIESFRILD